MRGRVGRSHHQAFAYLLYDPHRRITETAEKRLRTIFEATDLGAGFKIGMKELEIILQEAGFEQIRISAKEASREFIRNWVAGRNVADYVVSATIEAIKPRAACCAPGCCE